MSLVNSLLHFILLRRFERIKNYKIKVVYIIYIIVTFFLLKKPALRVWLIVFVVPVTSICHYPINRIHHLISHS